MISAIEFISVGALWGGSFLFMRFAGPQFGAVPLIGLRVLIGGLVLLPLCVRSGQTAEFRSHWKKVWILGFTSAAAPFTLLTYATIQTNAGFSAILNSTTPFFTALIGWLWLKDKPSWSGVLGLIIGFIGVTLLVKGKVSFDSPQKGTAVMSALIATTLYGFSINYTKHRLKNVSPLFITAISQLSGAIIMFPFLVWLWPSANPSGMAWTCVILLGIGSTAVAFLLFYRLIAKIGATQAIVVAYLIPVFGMIWGALFLGEKITFSMVVATAVILLGTSFSTGLLKWRASNRLIHDGC